MKINKSLSVSLLLLCFASFIISCGTQKAASKDKTETEESTEIVPAVDTTNERGCEMYGGDEKKAKAAYSLYREDFKTKNYIKALPNWKWVYYNAPGLREQAFKDGDIMYKSLMEEETDPTKKAALFDTLMAIYDQRAICWGESAFLSGKKALAYYKYYPEEEDKIFDFVEKAVNNGGNTTPASQLKLYFRSLLKKLKANEIVREDLDGPYDIIKGIIDHNIENGEADKVEDYEKALSEIEPIYTDIKGIKVDTGTSITSCSDVETHVVPKYRENPEDVETIKFLYKALYNFKCYDNPLYLEALEKLVKYEPTPARWRTLAKFYRSQKNFGKAITALNEGVNLETDPIKKSKMKMTLASIYAFELDNKDFSAARKAALEAAEFNPNWGKPYVFVGRLYSASGKLCGPGTGFESQKVLFPAFDMWNKAKRVDPSSADDAQSWINKYYQYLPTNKDIFQRGIKEGGQYPIKCWIGGTGTIRIKK